MNALVSVITPCYNNGATLLSCIDSVYRQSDVTIEHIIIDDCSDDNTMEVLTGIPSLYNIIVIRNKSNLGAAKSRNLGLSKSKGKYIAFLDADDIWLPDKLYLQIQYMQAKNIFLLCSNYITMDTHGKVISIITPRVSINYSSLLFYCDIGTLTVLINRDLIGEFLFPDIRMRQDYALWLHLLKRGHVFHSFNIITAICNKRPQSLSANKFKAISSTFLVFTRLQKFGIIKSFFYIFHHFKFGLKNYSFRVLLKPFVR